VPDAADADAGRARRGVCWDDDASWMDGGDEDVVDMGRPGVVVPERILDAALELDAVLCGVLLRDCAVGVDPPAGERKWCTPRAVFALVFVSSSGEWDGALLRPLRRPLRCTEPPTEEQRRSRSAEAAAAAASYPCRSCSRATSASRSASACCVAESSWRSRRFSTTSDPRKLCRARPSCTDATRCANASVEMLSGTDACHVAPFALASANRRRQLP